MTLAWMLWGSGVLVLLGVVAFGRLWRELDRR